MNYKPPILVCDDEPHTLHVVGSYLRRAGLGVTLTANAEQALRAAAASWPGLCILEHNSTGTNGIELCRRLREMPGLATVPVIVLTARNGRLPEMTVSSATPTA
ncbi:MAG: response regulator, partial [Planctomycetota bacterium]